jgi:hypothetical protein
MASRMARATIAGVVVFMLLLGLLRFKPWRGLSLNREGAAGAQRQELAVGYLPVT